MTTTGWSPLEAGVGRQAGESDLLPRYGLIFGMGDGTCNVGLGTVASTATSQKLNYRDLLRRWLDNTPAEWGFSTDNQVGGTASAPADGVQPKARLHPRAGSGRRLRRHGLAVQRRGHSVRDGGR